MVRQTDIGMESSQTQELKTRLMILPRGEVITLIAEAEHSVQLKSELEAVYARARDAEIRLEALTRDHKILCDRHKERAHEFEQGKERLRLAQVTIDNLYTKLRELEKPPSKRKKRK